MRCGTLVDFIVLQEAAKGTRKRVDLSRVLGMQIPPVDVDIPAGVDSGQQIQVRH
jgi:hypothetical protein